MRICTAVFFGSKCLVVGIKLSEIKAILLIPTKTRQLNAVLFGWKKGCEEMKNYHNNKQRSLFHQILYACNKQTNYSADKHSIKKTGSNKKGKVYSVGTKQNQVDTIRNFTNFMKQNHPNIKMVKDVKQEHVEDWYKFRSPRWSDSTCVRYQSEMRTITKQVRNTYYSCKDLDFGFKAKLPERESSHLESKRISMSKEDLEIIRETLKNSRSQAKIAIEVSARAGLRIREVCYLAPDKIEISQDGTACTIHIIKGPKGGSKGGRGRDIEIYKKDDIEYFSMLKEKTQRLGYMTVVNGVKPDSINKALDRTYQKIGANFAERMKQCKIHGTRKLFAKERLQYYLDKGMDKTEAENLVIIQDLGHDSRREKLLKCYLYGK